MYPPKRLGYKAPNCEMVFVNCTISSQAKSSHMVAVMEDGEGGVGGGLVERLNRGLRFTWREEDPRRRIIQAPYVCCIRFTCKGLYLFLELGSS